MVGGAASTEAMASTKGPPRPLPARSRPSKGPTAAALRISDLMNETDRQIDRQRQEQVIRVIRVGDKGRRPGQESRAR